MHFHGNYQEAIGQCTVTRFFLCSDEFRRVTLSKMPYVAKPAHLFFLKRLERVIFKLKMAHFKSSSSTYLMLLVFGKDTEKDMLAIPVFTIL